ncbi:hypothetical protein NW768_002450 [Fusarium equiseti]|uniref:DUF7908 domain-containing protein n=1 Tax=Fusarium equiseti TaxID=61235 RepID=A0ABQ8RNL6_FUSEQ|nr:hypothetical protein NW768_002450 [Fusarium equiseti]
MRSHVTAFALLGGVVASQADIADYEPVALGPATYCITYESTYLAPISIGANSSEVESSATDEPGFLPSDSSSLPLFESTQEALTTTAIVNTEDPAVNTDESTAVTETFPLDTDQPTFTTLAPEDTEEPSIPTESTATQPVFEPTGQRVIFLVTPAGELTKRDVGGFVGNGNPDVCTFASIYTLGQGQLFVGNVPVSYSGEEFQPLDSVSAPLDGAITTTFSSDGGVLSFANRGLPGGRASFCQTPLDGQVYITYRSRPPGCVFITLTVYGAERCINGKIDGLDDNTTTGLTQTEGAQTEGAQTTDSPVTATDPLESTGINVPEESETNIAQTTNINIPEETETDSAQTTEDNVPEQTETDTPPNPQTTNGGIDLPTMPTIRTSWTWANTSFTAPSIAETTRIATTVDVLSSTDAIEESTTAEEDLDTSTSLEPTTTTTTAETTTTQGAVITVFNVARNGRFAGGSSGDQDIQGFVREGDVERTEGVCFKDDGSPDDSCVLFGLSGSSRKRDSLNNSGRITQRLTNLNRSATYTVQFYYYIQVLGGSGASCMLGADAGIFDIFEIDLLERPLEVWQKAIASIEGDATQADLSIYINCPSTRFLTVFVDSLFVTDEATEDNIDEFELDYGEPGNGGGNGNGNGNGNGSGQNK